MREVLANWAAKRKDRRGCKLPKGEKQSGVD